ncbi:quinone oxidoreductase [bacterium]|nr:quinone oxidoreductase [bacterium]
MRAVVVETPGELEQLRLTQNVDMPTVGENDVLVRIAYAGLNFMEVLIRRGDYLRNPKYPLILGSEASGIVEQVGANVKDFKPGDRVAVLSGDRGCYAEYVCVDETHVVPIPAEMELRTAAAYPLQVLTAWGILFASARIREGDWVLVHACAGGVGLALVQMARIAGCQVIGTTSSEDKAALAREMGCQHVINYTQQDFGREVRKIVPEGVNIICDSVGKVNVIGNLRSIANFGLIVVFGYASGEPKYDEKLLWGRSCGITMNGLYHLVPHRTEFNRAVRETTQWILDGRLNLHIGQEYDLADVQEAHRQLEGRQSQGKLLLRINSELK